jgi:Xaa-Pro dipeptidase
MEFPREEYERRVEAVRRRFVERGGHALLVADEANYRYITGHHTEAWKNPARPRACWVPREGSPMLIVPPGEAAELRETGPWNDIREYEGPAAGPAMVNNDPLLGFEPGFAASIAEGGKQLGVAGARGALAIGGWSKLDIPYGVLLAVESDLQIERWIDAAPDLWETRSVKSEAEVTYLRGAVRSLDDAYADTFSSLDVGVTEAEVARTMRANILRAGADHPLYTIAVSDVSRPRAMGATPGERPLEPGALMMIDAGAMVSGYRSDYSRMAAVGRANDRQKRAYLLLMRAHLAGIRAARAGSTAGDITQAMRQVLESESATMTSMGRMGHGIGLEVPEPPSLHLAAETTLRPGMVICIEPNFVIDGVGTMVAEDTIVIRDDKPEYLSNAPMPPELFCI